MEPLISFITTDFSGITRGRAIPTSDFKADGTNSVGWVPANASINPFDQVVPGNPWGSRGDLRLLADPHSRFSIAIEGSVSPLDVVFSDIIHLDGTRFCCCARTLLKNVLAELTSLTGLELVSAFEHEFQLIDPPWRRAAAFSLQAQRSADPLGGEIVAALRTAGIEPEVFIPEFGENQFEVSVGPKHGLRAADEAVLLREIVREAVRNRQLSCSFTPKLGPKSVGNGVHIHFSLVTKSGEPTSYDASNPGGMSSVTSKFVAGILKHLKALVAITAPSPVSYLRLKPHSWSSSYTWLGDKNREATVRICPLNILSGQNPARGFNIEYRAADATASPHLALAFLVKAGLAGIQENFPPPAIFEGDPTALSAAERENRGLHRLPESLQAALQEFEGDTQLNTLFEPEALSTYLGLKRSEIAEVSGKTDDEACAKYAGVY